MARTVATLPPGARITDFMSLGVLANCFPLDKVHEVLQQTERESQRQRHLPAHVMVYYVIALALYMEVSYGEVLRCLLEGLEWLGLPVERIRCTGRSGISLYDVTKDGFTDYMRQPFIANSLSSNQHNTIYQDVEAMASRWRSNPLKPNKR